MKKIITYVLTILLLFFCTACSTKETNQESQKETDLANQLADWYKENESVIDEMKNSTEDYIEESIPECSEETDFIEESKNEEIYQNNSKLSFALEGKTYTLPFEFEELKSTGWFINPDGFGAWNKEELQAYEQNVSVTNQVLREGLDENIQINIALANLENIAKKSEDCTVYQIFIQSCYLGEEFPIDLTVNGVTIGDTYEKIKEMYGEPNEASNDLGVYTYKTEFGGKIKFVVDPSYGLYEIYLSLPSTSVSDWDDNYTPGETQTEQTVHEKTESVENILEESNSDLDAESKEIQTKPTVEDNENKENNKNDKDTSAEANGDLSDDWQDFEFILDDKKYTMPFAYQELLQEGWSFDYFKEFPSGKIIKPNDTYYSEICLTNILYPDMKLIVEFKNTSDKEKDILDCDICSVKAQVAALADGYGNGRAEMEIAGNIRFGSTVTDVINALGEPDSSHYSDMWKDTTLTYGTNKYKQMIIRVSDKYGVYVFEMINIK